jgi:hypothetical protein
LPGGPQASPRQFATFDIGHRCGELKAAANQAAAG